MKARRGLLWGLAGLTVVAILFYAFRPKSLLVETVKVQRGKLLEVTEEEGKTRMHDHFVIAAPISGITRRIQLHAGDNVQPGEIMAWIDPAPIDPRQNAVLEAHLNAALATRKQSEAMVLRTKSDYEQAQRDSQRSRALAEQGIISKESYEKVAALDHAAFQRLEEAMASQEVATHQVEEANAALLAARGPDSRSPTPIRTSIAGRVLRLYEQSERIVTPGTPLIEIGYTPHLEIVSDFLTREAVKIRVGMRAIITDWGGSQPLYAHVRAIEPGGFTKISALGVEEQRVNVVLDFEGTSDALQDGFHVQVSVITWESDNILCIPPSAVFRSGADWATFVVSQGVAKQTTLKIGHRGEDLWQVMEGVSEGAEVIAHPAAEIIDGVRVRER